jgi:hypothetical protein
MNGTPTMQHEEPGSPDAQAPVLDAAPAALPDAAPGVPTDADTQPAPQPPVPAFPPVVQVADLDWEAVRQAADPAAVRARMRPIVEAMESLLDRAGGPGMLFDAERAHADDRAIQVGALDGAFSLWAIGDLHGDLLALEAALAQIRRATRDTGVPARIIFLGDFFDDEGFGLELLLRVYELILEAPDRVCMVAGNHDEALSFDGNRFASTVSPSDFSDFLNANRAHEWIERVGKLAVRLTARAPRALFLPDGLLVAHGGFPLADLHARLLETGDWNDPACLSDFVWARAHPKARKKLPNRFSRGSQFGHEDFADFCGVAAKLGRPVTHMLRGHDHVEERFAVYPAYRTHPVLTIIALSRRLPREQFGAHVRAPTVARLVPGSLPEVHQLQIPAEIVEALFPPPAPHAEEAPSPQVPQP